MAAEDAAEGKQETAKWPMLLERFNGILGARGRKAATCRRQRRDAVPVEIYGQKQQGRQKP
jgi:hypothetical protein